ncbi:hypothetical protein D1BOALGB6SA_7208 [Olavius sp. associated proteobacterium Delta 1]|nr:hypothetical protein D1BOALGB6SA_7208 [Olavius sp. associated proteobacterium Delta 1]
MKCENKISLGKNNGFWDDSEASKIFHIFSLLSDIVDWLIS